MTQSGSTDCQCLQGQLFLGVTKVDLVGQSLCIVWPGQNAVLKGAYPAAGHDYDIMPNSRSNCHAYARISGDAD